MSRIDNMVPGTGRRLKEDSTTVNIADKIEAIAEALDIDLSTLATQATLALVLAQLDLKNSDLRDALRGAGNKTITDLATLLAGTLKVDAQLTGSRGSVIAHRTAITAADKVPTITITAADSATAGSLTAVAHGVGVAPGNSYGSAGVSVLVTVTPTADKSIDITIPQATGSEYYDIFLSASTTAPLWVARITETQRASGCAITAVGTVGEGGSAGVVNVQVVGTGQASTAISFAQNNAYIPASVGIVTIDCTGKLKAVVHVKLVLTDLSIAPTLSIVPFFQKNEESPTEWYQGQKQTVYVLGSLGQSLYQVFEIDCLSSKGMKILIETLSGNGASVDVDVELI